MGKQKKHTAMKMVLIILIFLSTYQLIKADGGDPTIQAVCKIKLLDGKSYEGFITLGYGSYNGIWVNGFLIKDRLNNTFPLLFSLKLQMFQQIDSDNYSCSISNSHGRIFKYLQWNTNATIENYQTTYKNKDTLHILTRIDRTYKIQDSIYLYQELSQTSYIDTKENPKRIAVCVKDINTFELFKNPPQKWIEEINKRKQSAEKIFYGSESTGDYLPASWYHDIILDEKSFARFQQMIDYNNSR
jgi:hypothetical protein